MGAYPTVHKPTFNDTLDTVRVMVIVELEKMEQVKRTPMQILDMGYGSWGEYLAQNDGEKKAYEKVLAIIKNLREKA